MSGERREKWKNERDDRLNSSVDSLSLLNETTIEEKKGKRRRMAVVETFMEKYRERIKEEKRGRLGEVE